MRVTFMITDFQLHLVDTPQQLDGTSCGVIVCLLAAAITYEMDELIGVQTFQDDYRGWTLHDWVPHMNTIRRLIGAMVLEHVIVGLE